MPRHHLSRRARPRVEGLEERVVLATDIWIATGATAQPWSVETNWNTGHAPLAGDDVVLKIDANTNAGSAPCSLDTTTPWLNSVTFDATWNQTFSYAGGSVGVGGGTGGPFTLQTHTLTLNVRTGTLPTGYEITIPQGSKVHVDQDLEFIGGSVGGSGTLQCEGIVNVRGTSGTDKPTLGALLNLGDGTTATTMAFNNNTVFMVVKDTGNITVNRNATLSFDEAGTATVISNGDTGVHTITVAGGTVSDAAQSEKYVAMGVTVNSGELTVSTGATLHFTTASVPPAGNPGLTVGLIVNGGTVNDSGTLYVEQGIFLNGGTTTVVWSWSKLISGQNGASRTFYLLGGTLQLLNELIAHGGIDMEGGILTTLGSTNSKITMDAGDTFWMDGGELDVTPPTGDVATGKLEVAGGNMRIDGGLVVDNCNSSAGTSGQLKVDNNLTMMLSSATLRCRDVALYPNHPFSFAAITVGGTFDNGDFNLYDLPTPTSTHVWNNNVLTITIKD